MTRTKSAIARAVRLRKTYTGESHQLALNAIHGLRSGRQIVPDADSRDQRMLETALLLATRYAQSSLLDGPWNGHRVFRMVSPRPRMLTIDLYDDVVARFIRALIPPVDPSARAYGIPGVRVDFPTRQLRVQLLDVKDNLTDACVIIRNITQQNWKSIWETVQGSEYEDGAVDLLLKKSPGLTSGERRMRDFYWQQAGPIAMGSGMLRRMGLLKDVFAVDVWTGNGGNYLHVEIDEGPSVHDVVTALQHPVAGMAHGQVRVDTSRGPLRKNASSARIIDTNPAPNTFLGRPPLPGSPPGLILRSLPPLENDHHLAWSTTACTPRPRAVGA